MTTLGERIKIAREEKKLQQKELAELVNVKSSGVISNWERDLNKPDAEKIIKLCEVLDISVSYLLDYYGQTDFECTLSEQDLILKYRNLDNHGMQLINSILNIEYDRCIQEDNHTYITKLIDKYPRLASAGTGEYLFDDIPTEKIEVHEDCKADFAIGIYGDSMEPTYFDGQTVLVKKQSTLHIGDIGIFIADGDSFIKEYGKDGLISHNKKYPDILFKENIDIRIVGKVVGVYEE